ncbi:MAG: DUF2764 family protein [Clostridia bacterium]|nr:DUF2764 family protein [Clostridia bacterium]
MAAYYLISQLPSLDGINDNAPLPISEERFVELCCRFLGKKSQEVINRLTLSPSRAFVGSGSDFVDRINESERNLRFALGNVRAEKMKKSFDAENRILPIEYLKVASAATEIENPMEAEKYLNRFRLEKLETLRPMDNFSEDFIFYYGLKLKLLFRIRQFDTMTGEKAYKNIYGSILNGDGLEAKQ